MKISDIIKSNHPTLSFEFFPPRDDIGFWDLYKTIEKLQPLQPSFVSVTYGAAGSDRGRTVDLTARIKNDIHIESLAHLTCTSAGKREIAEVVDELKNAGIENILALRGDPPADQKNFTPPEDGFAYASDLAAFIRDRHDFCVGGACYPEVHPEAASPEADMDNLKRKVDAGCEFLITQLFFDNTTYYRFRQRAEAAGIKVPIIAGIMPILSVKQIKRFVQMCGASIPQALMEKVEAVEDDAEAVRHIGMFHATQQCRSLLEHGAPGIHFYTLNRSTATRAIYQEIKSRVSV